MSSFELLELFGVRIIDDADEKVRNIHVDFPPEDGAVALAIRDGEGPEWQQAVRQTASDLTVMRATYAPGAAADEYGARLFFPIDRLREFEAEQKRIRAEVNKIRDEGPDESMSAMWQLKEEVN
ncbi:MAG: hypothetical protein VYA67_21930 [Actinomycetota bacterium]|nr:hypothetical protein [Actinomycetota bacterium]